MLIVGSEIDSSSQRIINYLVENGIDINAITFNYYETGEQGFLARTFLIEPSRAETSRLQIGKRPKRWTSEELQGAADENGVGEVYQYLVNELGKYFYENRRMWGSITFVGSVNNKKRA